jgi:hypothetical protein
MVPKLQSRILTHPTIHRIQKIGHPSNNKFPDPTKIAQELFRWNGKSEKSRARIL